MNAAILTQDLTALSAEARAEAGRQKAKAELAAFAADTHTQVAAAITALGHAVTLRPAACHGTDIQAIAAIDGRNVTLTLTPEWDTWGCPRSGKPPAAWLASFGYGNKSRYRATAAKGFAFNIDGIALRLIGYAKARAAEDASFDARTARRAEAADALKKVRDTAFPGDGPGGSIVKGALRIEATDYGTLSLCLNSLDADKAIAAVAALRSAGLI